VKILLLALFGFVVLAAVIWLFWRTPKPRNQYDSEGLGHSGSINSGDLGGGAD